MNRLYFFCLLFLCIHFVDAQVSVSSSGSSPDPSAMLDVISTSKGMLCPRMTKANRALIPSPAHSLMIYQTDNSPGYYYNNGSPGTPQWIKLETTLSSLDHIGRTPIDTIPYVISSRGSYYLTKSVTSSAGITINASNVSIDLNGHTIQGSVGNTSAGISTPNPQSNINIANGFIVSWGKEGINTSNSSSCSFSNLMVSSCALDGIYSGKNTSGSDLIVRNNIFDGIDFGESSIITHSVAEANQSDGFELDQGAVLNDCSAKSNIGVGIKCTNVGTLTNCAAYLNTSHGFQCGNGSVVTANTAASNGGSGFSILASCNVRGNSSRSNSNHGYDVQGNDNVLTSNIAQSNLLSGFQTVFNRNQFESNTASFNSGNGYDITGTGCLVIKNTASNNTTSAFLVGVGNIYVTPITVVNINTNTNPNANISF